MTTILITGANRGIGLEFAKQYVADGADIIACLRDPAKADALKKLGGKVELMALEVTNSASVAALKRDLKGRPLDIVINNAGVSGPMGEKSGEVDFAAWTKTLQVNAIAPMLVSQALFDNLEAGHDKKLVTITSILGSTALHGGDMYAYRASKAAVNNIMFGLSKQWAKSGVAVGIFHPGWVQTDMGGKSAPVTPEQSVKGLRARIAELSVGNSGAYRDYAGEAIAW